MTIADTLLQYNAMIRFYYKEDPNLLSDEELCFRIKELKFLAESGLLKAITLQ